MTLSWTHPWELPGRWTPAPACEPEAPPERHTPEVSGAAAEAAAAQSATSQEAGVQVPEPEWHGTAGGERLFPDPWPAYGVLRFSPDEGLRIEAFGPSGDLFAVPASFALWGETLNGRRCSLLPARIEHERGSLGAHATREVVGDVFALGVHLRDLAELRIDRARLRFPGLREFLWHPHGGPVGLAEQERSAGDEAVFARDVAVPGARLTFRLAWEGRDGVHDRVRTRPGEVEVVLDKPAAFETWMREWLRPLRDLLVFAMREPSRTDGFIALFEEEAEPLWWKPDAPPRTETREVEIVQRESLLLLDAPRWNYRRLLFSLGELGELGDEANAALSKWFEMHRRLEPTAEFLFGALNTRLQLENAVLNLTSAAEGYHRAFHDEHALTAGRHAEVSKAMLAQCETDEERNVYRSPIEHANEPSQRRRLTLLYRRAATLLPQSSAATTAHVNQLVETRNYFVHQDVRHEHVRDGDDLGLLLQRLVMVLQANLLLDLGWPKERAATILRRSYEGQRVLGIVEAERPC